MDPIFKSNPNLKKFYRTSDGTAFYNENLASNHAKTLADKVVQCIEKITQEEGAVETKKVEPAGKQDTVPKEGEVANTSNGDATSASNSDDSEAASANVGAVTEPNANEPAQPTAESATENEKPKTAKKSTPKAK